MVRFILLGLLPLGLAACAQWPGSTPAWLAGGAPAAHYDFNWQLSGDPTVAPLQVFSGAGRTWLQFAPGRTPPALFAQTPAGLQPLSYTRREPYVIIDGVWPTLVLQGGQHVARVERQAAPTLPAPAEPVWRDPARRDTAQRDRAQGDPAQRGPTQRGPTPLMEPEAEPPQAVQVAPSVSGKVLPHYRAGLPDTTLRAVLARWAAEAGWSFEPQHWAVDADIPLAGSAEFPVDFKSAVRALLASSELADRPVQPCFYTNQVLRVVPLTQACDRSVSAGARS